MANTSKDNDALVAAVKGILGAIPVVGPLAAEIIGATIPNQRIHRVEDTLRRLESQLGEQAEQTLRSAMTFPEGLDLIEEAMIQAGRAVTDERRQHIASLLKNGLLDEEREHQIKKRVLETFERINDSEVILLYSRSFHPDKNPEFWEKHQEILIGPRTHIGAPPANIEGATMRESYFLNLMNLGLIKPRNRDYKSTSMVGLPSTNFGLTPFGHLMLIYLDLTTEEDRPY
nr:hypothetical protein [Pseudodesulfovibrio sp.]